MIMMRRAAILVLVVISWNLTLSGQVPVLPLAEAVDEALENNYDIRRVKMDVELAEQNAGILNSGYLPSLNGSGSVVYNRNTNDFELVSGESNTIENAETYQYSAGISLNYVVFDGMSRLYSYRQLKEQHQLSRLQARQLMENTLIAVYSAYFEVARLQEQQGIQQEILDLSRDRHIRTRRRRKFGQATGLEVLNAAVDLENDSIALLETRQAWQAACYQLNLLLGDSIQRPLRADTQLTYRNDLVLADLLADAMEHHVELQALKSNQEINRLAIRRNEWGGLPRISANAGYNYNQTDYGFNPNLRSLQTNGLVAGITLSWSLFDGGARYTQLRRARISREQLQLAWEQQRFTIQKELLTKWNEYQTLQAVLAAREKAVRTNVQNTVRAEKQYRLGQITSLDFRQAQVNLMNARLAYSQTRYNLKLAEVTLLRLSGRWVHSPF